MNNRVYENNGGGLLLVGDTEGVSGLEFVRQGLGLKDILDFEYTWYASDTINGTIGYNKDGNTAGNIKADGKEITFNDLVKDAEKCVLVAEYNGDKVILHTAVMGRAAKRYFGVSI